MPEIEFVTLANHAEAINGLLYLQGAGWTDVLQSLDQQGQWASVHFGMAVSVLIGWNETNRRYPLDLCILHEDGSELARLTAQVEAGRPVGIPPGSHFRSVLAVGVDMRFPNSGGHVLRATLEDKQREVIFRVNRPPGLATKPVSEP